jgi:butyrate kinase
VKTGFFSDRLGIGTEDKMKHYKIFVINPGSTSTKVELFEDEKSILEGNVFHDSAQLLKFPSINDQLDYRMQFVERWIQENHLDLQGVDAIVGRGGGCYSVEGGTYEIDATLIEDTRTCKGGLYHSSMLGVQMAERLHKKYGGLMLMVDPPVVDELQPVARITGVKNIYRRAICHALNQKATARQYAKDHGKRYEDLNLIVCHIDGGISVMAHSHGRMIDGNDAGGGQGPFTPTRMGSMAVTDVLNYLYGMPKEEIRKLCSQGGGLSSWFGTSNADKIHAMVEAGDEKASIVWEAMGYQVCKNIGAMAAVLHGQVDAIVLTGGLVRFADIVQQIKDHCEWIAPVAVYQGELEHEAMRDGALRVLRKEETARKYPGAPVFLPKQ